MQSLTGKPRKGATWVWPESCSLTDMLHQICRYRKSLILCGLAWAASAVSSAWAADLTIVTRTQQVDRYEELEVPWWLDAVDWMNDSYHYRGIRLTTRIQAEKDERGKKDSRSKVMDLDRKALEQGEVVMYANVQKLGDREVLVKEILAMPPNDPQERVHTYVFLDGKTWRNFKDGQTVRMVAKGRAPGGKQTLQRNGVTLDIELSMNPPGTTRTCLLSKWNLVCNTPEVVLSKAFTMPPALGQKDQMPGWDPSITQIPRKRLPAPGIRPGDDPLDIFKHLETAPAL